MQVFNYISQFIWRLAYYDLSSTAIHKVIHQYSFAWCQPEFTDWWMTHACCWTYHLWSLTICSLSLSPHLKLIYWLSFEWDDISISRQHRHQCRSASVPSFKWRTRSLNLPIIERIDQSGVHPSVHGFMFMQGSSRRFCMLLYSLAAVWVRDTLLFGERHACFARENHGRSCLAVEETAAHCNACRSWARSDIGLGIVHGLLRKKVCKHSLVFTFLPFARFLGH